MVSIDFFGFYRFSRVSIDFVGGGRVRIHSLSLNGSFPGMSTPFNSPPKEKATNKFIIYTPFLGLSGASFSK